MGGPQKPLDDVGRDRAIQAGAEQGVGVLRVQAVDLELGQPRRIEATRIAGARGHEQRDRLGLEAPRGEDERLGRRRVQPLGVVDAAQHRATVAGLGQQAQQAGGDEKAILDAVEAEAQRAAQSRGLGGGEAIDELQARAHELVHAGEGQLVLGLDADAAQHRHVARAVGGVLEQRGLADPRLAAQHERGTALAACALKERIEGGPLGLTPDEHLVAILIPTHVGGDWGGGLGGRPIRPWPGDRSLAAMSSNLASAPSAPALEPLGGRVARGGVLVLGGGFAGAYVARQLGRHGATIVNPTNFMLYTPLLPEAAARRRGAQPGHPGRPDPPTCQHALRQARRLWRNLRGTPRPYKFCSLGHMATLGRRHGIAVVAGLRLRGIAGWAFARGYHVLQLPFASRRARVVADWATAALFRRDLAELSIPRATAQEG